MDTIDNIIITSEVKYYIIRKGNIQNNMKIMVSIILGQCNKHMKINWNPSRHGYKFIKTMTHHETRGLILNCISQITHARPCSKSRKNSSMCGNQRT